MGSPTFHGLIVRSMLIGESSFLSGHQRYPLPTPLAHLHWRARQNHWSADQPNPALGCRCGSSSYSRFPARRYAATPDIATRQHHLTYIFTNAQGYDLRHRRENQIFWPSSATDTYPASMERRPAQHGLKSAIPPLQLLAARRRWKISWNYKQISEAILRKPITPDGTQ